MHCLKALLRVLLESVLTTGETMLPILVPVVLFVACIAGMLFIKD